MTSRRSLASLAALLVLAPHVAAQGPGAPPPLQPPPAPPGNPVTQAKADLGRALFWDEQLSSTRSVACGTCHVPAAGGSDPRSLADPAGSTHPGLDGLLGTGDDVTGSAGVPRNLVDGHYVDAPPFGLGEQVTARKSPSAIGAAFAPELFWDGRADDVLRDPLSGEIVLAAGAALENQALAPPVSSSEMAHLGRDWNDVAARVAASEPLALSPLVPAGLASWIAGRDYPALFAEAFGDPSVTPVRIALAIATYERTLVPDQTPFDAFLAGQGGLTPLEQQGRQLFNALACNNCHAGARLTNDAFFYIGVRPVNEDLGRFAVTGNLGDRGRFRTPSLRNVELRGPYFHNGGLETLEEVVEFYDRGGDFNAPNKDPRIVPLGLTDGQKAALVAFLKRPLTDPRVAAGIGPFARPLLWSETNLASAPVGAPTPGSGGFAPRAVAVEPAWVANPNLTLAVDGGLGGAPVALLVDALAAPGGIPVPGTAVTLHLALTPSLFAVNAGALSGIGPGNGSTSLAFDFTLGPEAAGLALFGQWLVIDPGASPGILSASAAFELDLF